MVKKIYIYINGQRIKCQEGETVLQIAIREKIDIPHFCYHEDLPVDSNCRACLVEDQKDGKVTTSCNLKVKSDLKVLTDSAKVKKLRKQNMELLFAGHKNICNKCKKGYFCKTAEVMKKYKITGEKYKKCPLKDPLHKLGDAAEFDPKQCISCNKCVEICNKIGIGFLKLKGKGAKSHVTYNCDPEVDCIYCGQCTAHCPVAAVREQNHLDDVLKLLKDKNRESGIGNRKIMIAQMAPSVRASIGEEFGLAPGKNMEGQMYTALRELGFDYIFDVNMGADITTYVEAEELVERIKENKHLPMFTSCCPGWVKFVEFYHPELIPNLTTSRSPQIHSGGAYKTWWAEKAKIDPKKIVVVSFMPCTSKKYEAKMKKFQINGLNPVDYVLTTREAGTLLKKYKINLPKLKPSKVDEFGKYTGAAAIYGASGGVMESALRTAYYFLTSKDLKKVEFKKVRGIQGVKEASIKIGDKTINVAVVATARNIKKVLQVLEKNPKKYHYIEVMACPGGCIGGGGQPLPNTMRIVQKRIKALYNIDDHMKLRLAHKNLIAMDFMNYTKKLPKKQQDELLITSYKKKKKFE